MTDELKQEYTRRITQANKTQMIVILYEMALTYVEEAEEAHGRGDRGAFRDAIRKARGCVNELLASLNFEYELSMNFLSLYLYVNRELAGADVRDSAEPLKHAVMVLKKLHGAYETISVQDDSGPMMENTQTVYAGLTYGKSDLTESLTDDGSCRGFRV